MSKELIIVFTAISGICSFILITIFINFIFTIIHSQHKSVKSIHSLIKKCGTISLFGSTTFVFLSFILDLINSLYFTSINIEYTKILCQLQTFNIVFFMTVCFYISYQQNIDTSIHQKQKGKLAMYLFFMLIVHVSFRGSFLAYPQKLIGSLAATFFVIMYVHVQKIKSIN